MNGSQVVVPEIFRLYVAQRRRSSCAMFVSEDASGYSSMESHHPRRLQFRRETDKRIIEIVGNENRRAHFLSEGDGVGRPRIDFHYFVFRSPDVYLRVKCVLFNVLTTTRWSSALNPV